MRKPQPPTRDTAVLVAEMTAQFGPRDTANRNVGWWNDTERDTWHSNMVALEKAFTKEGIGPTAITAEMATRWRETGIAGRNAKRMEAQANRKRTAKATSAPTCDLNSVFGTKRRTTQGKAI